MDKKTVMLLMEQNLETIKSFIELMVEGVKKDVDILKGENRELKNSLQYSQTEIDELKATVRSQNEEIRKLQQNAVKNKELGERIRVIDDFTRKKNLRIEGIPESDGENHEQTQKKVEQLIAERMNIETRLETATRIGKKDNTGRPRPIVAKFTQYNVRQKCLRTVSKLKGTNIYINEDVSKLTMDRRTPLMGELREKRRQGYIAYFVSDRLVVRKRSVNSSVPGSSNFPNTPGKQPPQNPQQNPISPQAQREAIAAQDYTRPGSPLCYASAVAASKAEQHHRQLRSGNSGISTKHK